MSSERCESITVEDPNVSLVWNILYSSLFLWILSLCFEYFDECDIEQQEQVRDGIELVRSQSSQRLMIVSDLYRLLLDGLNMNIV